MTAETVSIVVTALKTVRDISTDPTFKKILKRASDSLSRASAPFQPKLPYGANGQYPSGDWRVPANTIVITTGCNAVAENFDRPVALALRTTLELIGEEWGISAPQAIIIGDDWNRRTNDSQLQNVRGKISIGSPGFNEHSQWICNQGEDRSPTDDQFIYIGHRRFAIWGTTPLETSEAVGKFIERHLMFFLTTVWNEPKRD